MTTLKVNTITDAAGTGAPDAPNGITLKGVTLANANTLEYTASGSAPSSPKDGAIWWDTGTDELKTYINDTWQSVSYVNKPLPWGGETAVFGGGSSATGNVNTMDYVSIDTTGNATDFGDMTVSATGWGGLSNSSRGCFCGGNYGGTYQQDNIDYITIATPGNATDFGNLGDHQASPGTASDGTYGMVAGGFGYTSGFSRKNGISRFTIATTGNATSFAYLPVSVYGSGGVSDGGNAIWAGGNSSSGDVTSIYYNSFTSGAMATSFGSLAGAVSPNLAGASNTVRGLFAGDGGFGSIQYITMATPGNATNFGSLSLNRYDLAGCANYTRAIFGGGYASFNRQNVIDYVTIDTTGNATDFGDLTVARQELGACAGS